MLVLVCIMDADGSNAAQSMSTQCHSKGEPQKYMYVQNTVWAMATNL